MTVHRIQDIGFKVEAVYGTDPITNGLETFYKFGLFNKTFGKFPLLETEVVDYYTGVSYDPQQHIVANTKVTGNIIGVYIHGIIIYMLFCRDSSNGTLADGGASIVSYPTWVITGITDGELQSYTVRFTSGSSTGKVEQSIVGCRFNTLTLALDATVKKSPLTFSIGFEGKLMQPVVAATSDYSIIEPDSLAENEYYWDNTVASSLDFDGTELKTYLHRFSYTVNTTNRGNQIQNQHYKNNIVSGDRIHMLIFTIERNTTEATVFDAYLAQSGTGATPAEVFYDITFTIGNSASNSLSVLLSDCAITSVALNHAFIEGKEVPTYEVTCRPLKATWANADGVTTLEHYGFDT